MTEFYRNVPSQPKAEALQTALIHVLSGGARRRASAGSAGPPVHPFYWAGVVMFGDPR